MELMALLGMGLGVVIVIGLIVAAIMIVIGALIVRGFCSLAFKFKPSFGHVLLVVFLGALATFVFQWIWAFSVDTLWSITMTAIILQFVIVIAIRSVIYGLMLKTPDAGPLGIGRGIAATLVELVVLVNISLILYFILIAIMLS